MRFNALATAPAILIVSAFVFSIWEKYKADQGSASRDWQTVVIYSLLEEHGKLSFDELKAGYLEQARQLLPIEAPNKELQDHVLRRILLDLQRDNMIVKTEDAKYQLQRKAPIETWALEELKRMQNERVLRSKILNLVEQESGRFTIDTLVAKLQEEHFTVSFDEVDNIVYSLRGGASLRKKPDGTLEFVPPFNEQRVDDLQPPG